MNEHRLRIVDETQPQFERQMAAYELERARLQHLLQQNPPPEIKASLEAQMSSVERELWVLEKSLAFLTLERATIEAELALRGGEKAPNG